MVINYRFMDFAYRNSGANLRKISDIRKYFGIYFHFVVIFAEKSSHTGKKKAVLTNDPAVFVIKVTQD